MACCTLRTVLSAHPSTFEYKMPFQLVLHAQAHRGQMEAAALPHSATRLENLSLTGLGDLQSIGARAGADAWLQLSRKTSRRLESTSSAVTGRLFNGVKQRSFPRSQLHFAEGSRVPKAVTRVHSNAIDELKCNSTRWAVATTISEPSEGIRRMSWRTGWCLVVVADRNGPPSWSRWMGGDGAPLCAKSTKYLTVEDQEALGRRNTSTAAFISAVPWAHFGRKNVGFLYAIAQGATELFDFDDDNWLYPADRVNQHSVIAGYSKKKLHNVLTPALTIATCTAAAIDVPTNSAAASIAGSPSAVVNPYPLMRASNPAAWPRGLPYPDIRRSGATPLLIGEGECLDASRTLFAHSIAVMQSVADHDPDVDAIYRLTATQSELHFSFLRDGPALVLPPGIFAPINAQATLHMRKAMWGALLPTTVHGRVSDIWRGYLHQRLYWDIGLQLAFTSPSVTQQRNAHNYLADMQSELPLYERAGELVRMLTVWRCDDDGTRSLPSCMEALWVEAYERSYLEKADVHLVQRWLAALADVGYRFPPRLSTQQRKQHEETELAAWNESLCTALPSPNGCNASVHRHLPG